jgi:hypothetical protein
VKIRLFQRAPQPPRRRREQVLLPTAVAASNPNMSAALVGESSANGSLTTQIFCAANLAGSSTLTA